MNEKIFQILLSILSIIQTSYAQEWKQIGNTINGDIELDRIGRSYDVNAFGNRIAISYLRGFNIKNVKVFEFRENVWQQIGDTIKESDKDSQFGEEISINNIGNVVAIASYNNNKNGNESGNVKIFEIKNNQWKETTNFYGKEKGNRLGIKIKSNNTGNIFAIGQESNNQNSDGSVWSQINIYKKNENTWRDTESPIKINKPSSIGEYFNMSKDGNTVVFGGVENSNSCNITYVEIYKFKDSKWTKSGKAIYINTCSIANFPELAISKNGSYLAVGLPNAETKNGIASGQINLYDISNNNKPNLKQVIEGDKKYDYFGSSLSMNDEGNIIGIGTLNSTTKKEGYIKIFKSKNQKFSQVGQTLNGSTVKLNSKGDIVVTGNIYSNNEKGIIKVYKLK
jgi:hypothetical protein